MCSTCIVSSPPYFIRNAGTVKNTAMVISRSQTIPRTRQDSSNRLFVLCAVAGTRRANYGTLHAPKFVKYIFLRRGALLYYFASVFLFSCLYRLLPLLPSCSLQLLPNMAQFAMCSRESMYRPSLTLGNPASPASITAPTAHPPKGMAVQHGDTHEKKSVSEGPFVCFEFTTPRPPAAYPSITDLQLPPLQTTCAGH